MSVTVESARVALLNELSDLFQKHDDARVMLDLILEKIAMNPALSAEAAYLQLKNK